MIGDEEAGASVLTEGREYGAGAADDVAAFGLQAGGIDGRVAAGGGAAAPRLVAVIGRATGSSRCDEVPVEPPPGPFVTSGFAGGGPEGELRPGAEGVLDAPPAATARAAAVSAALDPDELPLPVEDAEEPGPAVDGPVEPEPLGPTPLDPGPSAGVMPLALAPFELAELDVDDEFPRAGAPVDAAPDAGRKAESDDEPEDGESGKAGRSAGEPAAAGRSAVPVAVPVAPDGAELAPAGLTTFATVGAELSVAAEALPPGGRDDAESGRWVSSEGLTSHLRGCAASWAFFTEATSPYTDQREGPGAPARIFTGMDKSRDPHLFRILASRV